METSDVLILAACILCTLIGFIGFILVSNNKTYCKYFLRKQWKLWEDFIEEVNLLDNIMFDRLMFCDGEFLGFKFLLTDSNDNPRYDISLWVDNNTAAIYNTEENGGDLLLSSYDEYHSKEMFDFLIKRVPEKALEEANEKFGYKR